ncbi:MAG: hypothetical protein D3924_14440 [Candidatus Electrothrix sp. AR4]|nr:hypothetical protein [Candidatus Electrothrix sp. AR4]
MGSAKNTLRRRLAIGSLKACLIERKLKTWLAAEEEEWNRVVFLKEKNFLAQQILMVTDFRIILFQAVFLGQLEMKSEKIWRQFISVDLREGFSSSTLFLSFFHFDDVIPRNTKQSRNNTKRTRWCLDKLNKKKAKLVYDILKGKELYWKEKRKDGSIDFSEKPPKSPPPKKLPSSSH